MHAIATVMELIGGLMVILNFPSTKLGAQTLIAFIVPMTVIMHLMPALTLADPEKKQNELIATLKNISILGGLLILYSKEASKAKKN